VAETARPRTVKGCWTPRPIALAPRPWYAPGNRVRAGRFPRMIDREPEFRMRMSPLTRPFLLIGLVLVLGLGGCGRRGPLEPPETAAKQQATQPATETGANLPGVPSPKGQSKRPPPITPPKEPFILDPLL